MMQPLATQPLVRRMLQDGDDGSVLWTWQLAAPRFYQRWARTKTNWVLVSFTFSETLILNITTKFTLGFHMHVMCMWCVWVLWVQHIGFRGFFKRYALYKSTFYLLTYLLNNNNNNNMCIQHFVFWFCISAVTWWRLSALSWWQHVHIGA